MTMYVQLYNFTIPRIHTGGFWGFFWGNAFFSFSFREKIFNTLPIENLITSYVHTYVHTYMYMLCVYYLYVSRIVHRVNFIQSTFFFFFFLECRVI